MPDTPEHVDRLEVVRDSTGKGRMFDGRDGSIQGWGQLYISVTGRTVGGWLVHAWCDGEPHLRAQQHWFDKGENKFYYAVFDFNRNSLNLHGEDTDIEPARAAFIRKMTANWEREWLQDVKSSS